MFNVFKPKGSTKVKAVKVTVETVEKLAVLLNGRLVTEKVDPVDFPERGAVAPKVVGFEYPTFEGIRKVYLNDWLVERVDKGPLDQMTNKDFCEAWEPARVTRQG